MEFRRTCRRCQVPLAPEGSAYICAHECTYCPTCVRALKFVCPNCAGELVRRPRQNVERAPSPGHVPDPSITVRRAVRGDLEGLTALFDGYRQFYLRPSDPNAARDFLTERLTRDESILLVAEDVGVMIGFTQLYPSFTSVSMGPIFVLNDLFVAPGYRRKGVGARLLAAAREFGSTNGAQYLELSTAVDNPAQHLYEASGWKPDREFLHYELELHP
jgi:ribosomal protein S18 acetylase RimI-like enzyme